MELEINRTLQLTLTVGGAVALILYFRSWRTWRRVVYDLPASVAMCGYMAQIVCEAVAGPLSRWWWTRAILMIPIAAIPAGRDGLGWRISGHVTTMLAVPLIQMIDPRLDWAERLAYWIPFPIVFLMHWTVWDRIEHGGRIDHTDTNRGVGAAVIIFALAAFAWLQWPPQA
jgi:hypothetical protein